jgi:transposase
MRRLGQRENRDNKIKSLKEYIKQRQEYYNTHYKAKKETLIKHINKKISKLKLPSFISYHITYKEDTITVKNTKGEEKIKTKDIATIEVTIDTIAKKEIEQLDGCYVIKTSLANTNKDSKEEIHKAYKTLIKVENAFKTLKTDFLEIRPLYLKTDKRIKGHVALSMLAYNICLKLKEYIKLAKLDFKDTFALLSHIKTVTAKLTQKHSVTYIPKVNENLQRLFQIMNFNMPNKVNYPM